MILALFSAAMFALIMQNLVFNGGYGVSEAIRIASKPKEFLPIAFMVTFFSTATAAICSALDYIDYINNLNSTRHVIMYCFVLAGVYLVFTAILVLLFKRDTEQVHRVGMAAVNTLVLAVPIINRRAAFGFAESVGLGIGAGIAFVIAVLLLDAAVDRIDKNDSMISDFKGKPALFIYIALVSLALAGFSGQSLFV